MVITLRGVGSYDDDLFYTNSPNVCQCVFFLELIGHFVSRPRTTPNEDAVSRLPTVTARPAYDALQPTSFASSRQKGFSDPTNGTLRQSR